MNPTDLINYQNAIKSIESSGGNYGLTGPVTRNGDRAYGAYQVMGNNIPSWTQKHFGQSLTPQQFLQNKDAQDAVFNGEFGGYVGKYGNPQDAASTWFTGRPLAQGGKSSDGYITGNQYVDKFNKHLGQDGGALAAIQNAAPTGGGMPQGALSFAGGGAQPQQAAADDNTPDAPGVLFQGEAPNKAHALGAMLANAGAAIAGISNPGAGANLRAIAQGISAHGGSKYQYQMGANGQLVRIDKESGKVDSIAIPGGQKGNFTPIIDKATGAVRGSYNHDDGTFTPASGGSQPAGPQIGGDPTLTGEDRLNSMSEQDKKDVQSIIDGRDPRVLSSMSLRNNPALNAKLEAAKAVDPTLDMNKIKQRSTYWANQATAAPSSWGGIIRRSGIGLDQLDKTIDNMGRLGNTSSALGPTVSSVENRMVFGKKATERAAIVKELETNAQNASTDINALQQGSHGTGAERESIKGGLNLPNEAPELQAAAAQAHLDAMRSVVQRAKDAEEQNVGKGFIDKDPRWAEYDKKINDAQSKLDKLKQGDFSYVGGNRAPAADTAKPGAIPSSWEDAQKAGWK